MVQLNPVQRDRLEAFIKDQRTVFDFEAVFLAIIETQTQIATMQAQVAAMEPYTARAGDIVFSAGTTRTQAVLANGASYLRAGTYATLFAAIGTQYGAADGTHFNVPDIAGRVIAGKEAVESKITTAMSGFSGATLGGAGGSEKHKLIVAEMPNHTHPQDPSTFIGGGPYFNPTFTGVEPFNTGGTTGATGGDGFHRNMQPTIILNAFILY